MSDSEIIDRTGVKRFLQDEKRIFIQDQRQKGVSITKTCKFATKYFKSMGQKPPSESDVRKLGKQK